MRHLSRKKCDGACRLLETWLVLATGIGDEFKGVKNSGIGERDDGSQAGVDEEKSGIGVAQPDVEACNNDCCS